MAITFDKSTKTFYLDGQGVTYAFFVNVFGVCEHLYFGKSIGHDALFYTRTSGGRNTDATVPGVDNSPVQSSYHHFPSEIAFFGTSNYCEPTVEVVNDEGDVLTELLFDGYEILDKKPRISCMPSLDGGQTLRIDLLDKNTDFAAELYYTVYDDSPVISRRIVYKNLRNKSIRLTRAYSFNLPLPDQNREIISLYGCWAKERHIQRIPIHHGVISIDSKRARSSAALNPFMAVVTPETTETQGEVYGFSLVYSSSYALKVEGTTDGTTNVMGGINDFGFEWLLEPGESLETPEVIIAYSSKGLGAMSRAFHDVMREHLICKRFVKKSRPIVINNWEGTYFDFNNEKLMAIASGVAGTGVDTFVLDDGWFGVRDNDHSGLGDWYVNTDKLLGGLDPIIKHVNSLGMRFGLWFEPEMINEDSDIYREHPEYAIAAPNRKNCYSRHQFVMDITRADVRDYIVESVNKILDNHNIEYVKWDYNRSVTEFYSEQLPPERQREFAHRYALGLYDLCERIIEAHPNIIFEGCAGGGGRFDPAVLYYFPQIWTSDDTDAEERTYIQYGTSVVYPVSSMSCHVSITPNHQTHRNTPMQTRAHIAALGATGYELDASAFTDEDRARTSEQIAEYKKSESLILSGDLYRVESPFESNYFAFMLVSKDKSYGELTCYRRLCSTNNEVYKIKAQGLANDKKYFVPELNLILSGSTLMNVGIPVDFAREDYTTVKYHFEMK